MKNTIFQILYVAVVVLVIVFAGYRLVKKNPSIDETINPSTETVTTSFDVTLEDIEKTFLRMEADPNWNVSEPLVWGYYFYDHDIAKLESFRSILDHEGLETYEVGDSAAKNGEYLLYVYESNVHTPESLLERCNILNELAIENSIEAFDGWEAGKEPL